VDRLLGLELGVADAIGILRLAHLVGDLFEPLGSGSNRLRHVGRRGVVPEDRLTNVDV